MDYRQSQRISRTKLSTLLQQELDSDNSLVGSIKSAISDKLKAKATGIKRAVDPLNLVSSLVGPSLFGKLITTGAGRILGRTGEDISYFGGYGSRGRYGSMGRNRKDPRRTTIGPGQVKPLKIDDSSADILAKIYNFMQKTQETHEKRYELEKSFREEQMEEDERRHKKLIEELEKSLGKKEEPVEEKKEEKEPSWIDKMLGGMKKGLNSLLDSVMKPIKFILGRISKVVGSLLKNMGSMVFNILTLIVEDIAELLFPHMKGKIVDIVKDAFSILGKFLPNFLKPIRLAMEALGTAYAITQGTALIENEKYRLATGKKVEDLDEKFNAELYNLVAEQEKLRNQKADTEEEKYDLREKMEKLEIQIGNLRASHKKEKEKAIQEANDFLIPKMADLGYYPTMIDSKGNYEKYPDGRYVFRNTDREEAGKDQYALATTGKTFVQYEKDRAIEAVKEETKEFSKKAAEKIKTYVEKGYEQTKKEIPELEEVEKIGGEVENIFSNVQNTIGSASKYIDNTPISPRDVSVQFRNRLNSLAF